MRSFGFIGRKPVRLLFPYSVALAAVAIVLAAAAVQIGSALSKSAQESEQSVSRRASALARSALPYGGTLLEASYTDFDHLTVLETGQTVIGALGLESARVYLLDSETSSFPPGFSAESLAVEALAQGTTLIRRRGSIFECSAVERRSGSGETAVSFVSARVPLALESLETFRRETLPGLFLLALVLTTPVVFLLYLSFSKRWTELAAFESDTPARQHIPESTALETVEIGRMVRDVVRSSRGSAGVLLIDETTKILAFNEAAADILDGRPDDFVGQSLRTLPCFGPAERSILRSPPGEWEHRTVILKAEQSVGAPVFLKVAVSPMILRGDPPAWLAILLDVTEAEDLKKEKERLLERELAVNSYAILAAMVRGFSHDLNSLLSGVIGAASLGDAVHDPGSPDRQRYEAILSAAERALAISEELLHSASLTENHAVPLDSARELEEISEALRSVLPRSISLEMSIKGTLPLVIADKSLLRQTVYNLALRSSGALQGSGRIRLMIEDVPEPSTDPRFMKTCRNLCGIHCVCLSLSDGTVLPMGLQRSLTALETDPYDIEKLYGAGIAAVHQAVKAMKGILVFSTEQRGTTLQMLLPAAQRAEESAGAERAIPGEDISVLIAEEEIIVRETTARILQHFGFRTVEASSGDEALAILDHESFDALLLDLGTFGSPSMDVAVICGERWPFMAILFTSGYEMPGDVSSFLRSRTGTGFLRKPYFPEAVSSEISRLVGSLRSTGDNPRPVR